MFLKCASNNQSETVLENFMEACKRFRVPTRPHTDHGTENVAVARAMLEIKEAETNPVLTGRSVHNQRIERLWVDLGAQVIHYFRDVFHHLESCCNLDPLNELNVVIPELNVDIDQGNLEYITNSFNPLHDDGNHRINLYNEIIRELTIR